MRRIMVETRCWICGNYVDKVPDKELMVYPHSHNAEFVVTHLGRKQYFHSKCWYGMIEEQKNQKENRREKKYENNDKSTYER